MTPRAIRFVCTKEGKKKVIVRRRALGIFLLKSGILIRIM